MESGYRKHTALFAKNGAPPNGVPRIHSALAKAGWPPLLLAVAELRRSNSGAPVELLRDLVVLRGIPERATILVDPHGAVVSPAVAGTWLRTSAGNYLNLLLQLAETIGHLASGYGNGWIRGSTT